MQARLDEARRRLDEAEETLADFRLSLASYAVSLRQGGHDVDAKMIDTIRTFTKARLVLRQEIQNYEKCLLENSGLVAEAPLDLDAVKSEIGRRLDRLRDTQGAG